MSSFVSGFAVIRAIRRCFVEGEETTWLYTAHVKRDAWIRGRFVHYCRLINNSSRVATAADNRSIVRFYACNPLCCEWKVGLSHHAPHALPHRKLPLARIRETNPGYSRVKSTSPIQFLPDRVRSSHKAERLQSCSGRNRKWHRF